MYGNIIGVLQNNTCLQSSKFQLYLYLHIITSVLCHRIERSVIESAGLAYRAAGGEQSNVAAEGIPIRPGAVPYPPLEPPPILKYLKGQVWFIFTLPMLPNNSQRQRGSHKKGRKLLAYIYWLFLYYLVYKE